MTENLAHWNRFADIDPKFTKPITGKDYTGTSPNPQYVIRCLTELFGPVGQGFGWRVLAEGFEHMGDIHLHWCRIEFWHTDRANTYEAYGQTKAAYVTAKGFHRVDEDAPKKSLTDAIVKAASHIGIAANIFLGRWDDQKYFASVNAEYRASEAPKRQAEPDADRVANACEYLTAADSLADLRARWFNLPKDVRLIPDVEQAKEDRKEALKPAAAQTPPADDLGGDFIPYEGK